VKTYSEVQSRLKKLRNRYAHKYVEKTQKRCHKNCSFNLEHAPKQLPYSNSVSTEFEIAPRIQQTQILISENKSIHLCMYGAKDTSTWPGDICDSDDKARQCPMFLPLVSIEQAKNDFLEKLSDDEYVFDNYRDVATLQWVLNERVYEIRLTLIERFWFWFKFHFHKSDRLLPMNSELPISVSELSSELWGDSKYEDPK